MALDRQTIEKRDFPIGRRGYDPDAVDAHLGMLADEIDVLKRSRGGGSGVAAAASEQVRLIVEAAEQSAGDIERDADADARRIRQEARDAAEQARADAGTQAQEHVGKVSDSATAMLERLDSMEAELRSTLDGLRSSAARLASDLSLLQGTVAELRGGSTSDFEPDLPADLPDEPQHGAGPELADEELPEVLPDADGDALAGEDGSDEEGARLIVLNMALNGTPRDEAKAYLDEHYALEDSSSLLDDVYAQVG